MRQRPKIKHQHNADLTSFNMTVRFNRVTDFDILSVLSGTENKAGYIKTALRYYIDTVETHRQNLDKYYNEQRSTPLF